MPNPPRSLDAALVIARPAAREAVVGNDPAPGAFAPVLSTLRMAPPPAAIRCGTARRVQRTAASTLRLRSAIHSSSETSLIRPPALLPALFTRPSRRPHRVM